MAKYVVVADDDFGHFVEATIAKGALPAHITTSDYPGFRIIIRKSGATFHCQYSVRGRKKRPMIQLGTWPEMSLETAYELSRTIVELARRGIDVEDGLHKRLMRELQEQGTNWRA